MDSRVLVAIMKFPREVVVKYTPSSSPMSTPQTTINGLMCLSWEYEGPEGCLSNVEAKAVIADELQSLQVAPTDEYSPEHIANGLSEAIAHAPLLKTPALDDSLPDSVIQFSMADMSQTEYDDMNNSTKKDINFLIETVDTSQTH